MPTVKTHTALDDILMMEFESNMRKGNKKRIFWQTSINSHRSRLRVKMNNRLFEGLLGTGAYVTIITNKSWSLRWPLQDVNVQFLVIEAILR